MYKGSKTSRVFVSLQCLAHVEAFIDFSEGELIEDGVLNQGASFKKKNPWIFFPGTPWRLPVYTRERAVIIVQRFYPCQVSSWRRKSVHKSVFSAFFLKSCHRFVLSVALNHSLLSFTLRVDVFDVLLLRILGFRVRQGASLAELTPLPDWYTMGGNDQLKGQLGKGNWLTVLLPRL